MKKFWKWASIAFGLIVVGIGALIIFFRFFGEAPMDYSSMEYELGPQDPEINGYTYLREFSEKNEAQIPDEYPYDEVNNIDYNRYENWDLEFFQSILETNRDFMLGVEAAFEREQFRFDQEVDMNTLLPEVGQLLHYARLRILEARVLLLNDQSDRALGRLQDLAHEVETYADCGGGLISLLTSIAYSGMLAQEISVFQARGEFSADQLLDFAQNYTISDSFIEAYQQAMRLEFHFVQHCMEMIEEEGGESLGYLVSASEAQLFLMRVSVSLGLPKERTLNEIYRIYSEIIDQSSLSVKRRHYEHMDAFLDSVQQVGWKRYFNLDPYWHALSVMVPSFEGMQERIDFARIQAAAVRLSLALQAYEQIKGRLPERLDALVPDYLPSMPPDVYDYRPMRYSKSAGIIYSIGDDFVDNGGSLKPYLHALPEDEGELESAERDTAEPTFPLRFLPQHRKAE